MRRRFSETEALREHEEQHPETQATQAEGLELREAISAAMVELHVALHRHDPTSASTYLNDNVVVCVLQNILTQHEESPSGEVVRGQRNRGRAGVETCLDDEFAGAIERLTHRRVISFLRVSNTTPGSACELFFLDAAPYAAQFVGNSWQ
jgi:uncharacterized protein YbcI